MKHSLIILLLLAGSAHAGGFAPLRMSDPGETCYSWQGGNFSAGSFSKCQPSVEVVVLQPMAPPPAVVAQAPVCPPQISVMPEPKPKPRLFHKPKPKVICKPV